MAKSELIARQSRLPTGVLGWFVARIMALDTAKVNDEAVDRLDPRVGDHVLEVGCGHGRTLAKIAKRVCDGLAAGIDPSVVMLRAAAKRNARDVTHGRVQIDAGEADRIGHPDAAFDKVLSVHTVYFWSDLDAGFEEIHRVLRSGGELLLAYRPSDDPESKHALPDSVYTLRSVASIESALLDAGFRDVKTDVQVGPTMQVAWTRAHA